MAAKVTCPKCSAENHASDRQCLSCGVVLAPPPPPQPHGSFTDTLIPVKNPYALIAYYLAVFSIIPCIGIILGLGAFVLGLMGLSHSKAHPAVKGRVHAWIGVIVGGIFGFGYLILTVLFLTAQGGT